MQEMWVQSLGWEDPLEEGMATHSSILAREIPWTELPGRLRSIGSQRVRHDWSDLAHMHAGNWDPTGHTVCQKKKMHLTFLPWQKYLPTNAEARVKCIILRSSAPRHSSLVTDVFLSSACSPQTFPCHPQSHTFYTPRSSGECVREHPAFTPKLCPHPSKQPHLGHYSGNTSI